MKWIWDIWFQCTERHFTGLRCMHHRNHKYWDHYAETRDEHGNITFQASWKGTLNGR